MTEEPISADHLGQPIDLITQSLETGKAIIDDNKQSWNQLVDQILVKPGNKIALRGAGSINGSDKVESDKLLETELIPRIEKALESGEQVTILYDGDSDSLEKPDIGYFAGRLLDRFGNNQQGVTFIAAQKKSWYYPKREGANLTNVSGKDFVTYVFDDNKYPGDHSAFTQDERLIGAEQYEQWYIGASGEVARNQLIDLNVKVPDGQKRTAILFRVKNNSALDTEINSKLDKAKIDGDDAKIAKFTKQLAQRENIFGAHWNNEGKPTLDTIPLSKLNVSFVTLT